MAIIIGRSKVIFSSKFTVFSSFKRIPNIGNTTVCWIFANIGLSKSAKLKSFTKTFKFWVPESVINRKFKFINRFFGKDYRQVFGIKYKKLRYSGSLKSIRLKFGLPVNGQRTHTNANTSKRKVSRRKFKP
jgi:ribosomal protein S13